MESELNRNKKDFSDAQMLLGWESLPLLPLKCILEHLSLEDALSALSICRHWRSAILLYEGRKETLKLRAKQLDRSLHLARLFRKHAKRLHIYVDCSSEELDKFLTYVLPQFFDTLDLQEILFIGPNYAKLSINTSSPVKLNRVLTESLVFKHLHTIRSLALLGCQMDTAKNENDRFMNKHTEDYSRALSFNTASPSADAILSRCNANFMVYSALRHIIVDYEQINTAALETLSNLAQFSLLTLNIRNKEHQVLPIDWQRVYTLYSNRLEVAINIIGVNRRKLDEIIANVLVEDLVLVSLKIMFCKTFHESLIIHVACKHDATLRELVWADSPCESMRRQIPSSSLWDNGCAVNPLILLCWRCKHLRRLVLHGHWIWQYDVVGMVKLRKKLEHCEISAIYNKESRFINRKSEPARVVRVLAVDNPETVDEGYVQLLNEYTEFKWTPSTWRNLHPALRARATAEQRADYVLSEVTRQPPQIAMNEE